MIPELGHFALILALCVTIVLGVFPLIGAAIGNSAMMTVAKSAARAQLVLVFIAFCCLGVAFGSKDFSVLYVAANSNSALPLHYRLAAIWGGHEGSLLLWTLILSLWTVAVTFFSDHLPEPMRARILGVMGLVSVGFLLFLLTVSNPFERLIPAAIDGRDLNPLLQDPGMVFHPPMLYMGYVGFSVAFAFAIAALIGGNLDATWARWSRPWTTVAWCFLTVGIAMGSAWAYYELGWGGWWFWDPVENASFMPWLAGTALVGPRPVGIGVTRAGVGPACTGGTGASSGAALGARRDALPLAAPPGLLPCPGPAVSARRASRASASARARSDASASARARRMRRSSQRSRETVTVSRPTTRAGVGLGTGRLGAGAAPCNDRPGCSPTANSASTGMRHTPSSSLAAP